MGENKVLPTIDDAWDYENPAKSEASFRALVADAEAAGNPAYRVEAMTQLARSLGLQRRFDEAHAVLETAQAALTPDMTVAGARWHLEKGRVINSGGDPAGSVSSFETALDLAGKAGLDYLAIDAAHMLGIVASPDDAIRWNEKAIAMTEATTDQRAKRWLGPLYNNLAWTYNDMGEHEKALSLFSRDVAFRESINRPFEASIALWSKAKTLRLLGRVEEALAIQLELKDHDLRQGNAAEGYGHEEIGECLLLLGRGDEARPHFAKAFARLGSDAWLQANEPTRLQRLQQLGN